MFFFARDIWLKFIIFDSFPENSDFFQAIFPA